MEKICAHCQQTFEVKRIDSVYCSRSCRQMAYINRKMRAVKVGIEDNLKHALPKEEVQFANSDLITKENLPETTIDGSRTVNEEKFLADGITKPSIDVLHMEEQKIKMAEDKLVIIQSKFVDDLIELNNDRPHLPQINQCLAVKQDVSSYYVSVRLRCLIECLLVFSEMKFTSVADLMEVCNAFTCVIRSNYFRTLPREFPYAEDVLRLKEKLKKICILVQHCQQIKFRFNRQDKLELIMIRFELAQYVSKKQFNQLDFQP